MLQVEQRDVPLPGCRIGWIRNGRPVTWLPFEGAGRVTREPAAHCVLPIGGMDRQLPHVVPTAPGPPQPFARGDTTQGPTKRRAVPTPLVEGLVQDLEQQRNAGICRSSHYPRGHDSSF